MYEFYPHEIINSRKEVDNIAKKLEVLDGITVDDKMIGTEPELQNIITYFKKTVDDCNKGDKILILNDLEGALLAGLADDLDKNRLDDNGKQQPMSIDSKTILQALFDYAKSRGVEVQFHIMSFAYCSDRVIKDIM